MEIIAKTEEGYILRATGDEVAHLVGYYSHNQTPTRYIGGRNQAFIIGDKINVHAMYMQLHNLSSISREADQAKKTLQAAIELLTIVDPVIRAVTDPKPEVQA